MAELKRLTIRGFKSIRTLEDFELLNMNVLIGANGAGKSNFLSLFRLVADLTAGRLKMHVAGVGGPDVLLHGSRKRTDRIDCDLQFEAHGYSFSLFPADDRLVFGNERISDAEGSHSTGQAPPGYTETVFDVLAPAALAELQAHSAVNWRTYHFDDTTDTAAIRNAQPVRDNLRLKPDGANLAPFLRFLREQHEEHYRQIIEAVRMVAPFFGDLVYRRDAGERVALEWFEQGAPDTPLGPRQLSDGTLRFLCLATLLRQPPTLQPDIILIDEPELGLHPYAITILAALLREVADRRQVVISTQSVDLVNEFAPDDVVVVNREDGASTFKRLDPAELQDWLQDYSLGQLWEMNVIGGRPSR